MDFRDGLPPIFYTPGAVLHEIPEPVTPDPEASSSKRDWERRIMKWRTTLKVMTGVIPLQELTYERLNNLRS